VRRRILFTLYGAVDFLIVMSKGLYGWGAGAGRFSSFMHLVPPPPTVWALKPPLWALHLLGLCLANICVCTHRYAGMHTKASPGWALVHKTTYASLIYTAPCVMLLMRAASITWASKREWALEILNFWAPNFTGPTSQGLKNSQFPGPNPLPPAQIMDAARIKSITHGAL
jgi:hypothetical protein